ncbi:Ethylene-responsive transcription factor ERF025 [Linum perenne]
MAANPPQESPPPPQQTPPSTRRRPKFRGIRSRSGKWVSEIREPKKTTRIWLGTYPTPEKAAAAYDVAAIALKGPHTPLNFPTSFHSYPVPASTSPSDIRSAAATAAADWMPEPERNVQAQHQASGSYTRNEMDQYMDHMASNQSQAPLSSPRTQPKYRGIRSRSGKWVSEIRQPKKTTRIWLGTYPTPEKAAAAYDVAAIALKGPHTPLNFPTSFHSYPIPASTSPSDIRSAAAMAAADWLPEPEQYVQAQPSDSCSWGPEGPHEQEYMDEEDMLNMPGLLVEMAGGMMISPPRMNYNTTLYEDFPDNSEGESLWSFRQF